MTRRNVTFHLTPLAHDVGPLAMGDDRRWMTFLNVAPAMAVAHLCHRLRVDPTDITVVVNNADIEIVGPWPEGGCRGVLALIAHGLEAPEITEALARIIAAREARSAAA